MKHTPGPWKFEPDSGCVEVPIDRATATDATLGRPVAYVSGIRSERLGNGRLIATAPELLDAAENLLKWLREFHPDEPLFSTDRDKQNVTISWMEAAIRKTKGESQ